MAKVDKLKEEVGWLKIIFSILIATDISLIAWLSQNYERVITIFLIICTIIVFLIMFAIIWINRVAYQKIDELEEL